MLCPPRRRSASTLLRPCSLVLLWLRRLNLGRTPPEWGPGPTRASPGGKRLRPPLQRSASAWRRPCRLARLQQRRLNLGRTPPEWAPGPTRASPGGDEAMPSPESLGFGQATPMQSGTPLAAQAESGPDPTRVGSQPDPGFARMERGHSHPCVSRFQPGDTLTVLRAFGRVG